MELLRYNYSQLERKLQSKSYEVSIGGKTATGLLTKEFPSRRIELGSIAKDMIMIMSSGLDFSLDGKEEKIRVAQATLEELGLTGNPTTEEWQKHIRSLDYLQLISRVAGPYLRLQDTNQRKGDVYYVAMNAITDSDGYPEVFTLERGGDDLWLYGAWAGPDGRWGGGARFVIGLRK